MSLLDMFKPAAPATPSASNPPASTPPADPNNLSATNPAQTQDGKMPGSDQTPPNPLDVYAKMFDNASKNSDIQAPSFNLDPKVIDDVASKMDFTKGLDPAVVQKALTGDPAAFMQAIQSVAQNSYKAAIQHNTSLTDSFINQRSEYEKSQINSGVHRELRNQALASTANFQHPVVKQELNRIADQFAKANPDASPVEIAEAAKRYLSDLNSALNPASNPNSPENKPQETDWTKYLSQ